MTHPASVRTPGVPRPLHVRFRHGRRRAGRQVRLRRRLAARPRRTRRPALRHEQSLESSRRSRDVALRRLARPYLRSSRTERRLRSRHARRCAGRRSELFLPAKSNHELSSTRARSCFPESIASSSRARTIVRRRASTGASSTSPVPSTGEAARMRSDGMT